MKRRTITLIIGLAVICLLGGVYFGLRSYNSKQEEAEEEAAEGETILEIFPDDIQEVSFDAEGEEISFARQDSGEWLNTDDEAFPVDSEVLLSSLDTLSDLKSVRTLKDPEDPAEYGLDDPQKVITVGEGNGEETVLAIGDSNELTGNDYLMLNEDSSVIYTVSEELRDAFSYGLYDYAIGEELPYISSSEITGIDAETADTAGYQLALENDIWLVDDEKADSDLVNSLREAAASLEYESYLEYNCTDPSAYGLDDPWAKLTVTWQEPATDEEESDAYVWEETEEASETETETLYNVYSKTWQIGGTDENMNYYVQLEGSTEVHTFDGSLISELFGYTAEDLEAETENK